MDKILESYKSNRYYSESVDIDSPEMLTLLSVQGLLGGPTCEHTSRYVAGRVDGAEAVKVVLVMKADETVAINSHYAVKYKDKLYDFTAGQYSKYPGPEIPDTLCVVLDKVGYNDNFGLVEYYNKKYEYKLFIKE